MLQNILANVADKTRNVSISEATLLALIGFVIVFIGIAFLILVVWLVGKGMSTSKGSPVPSNKKDESHTIIPVLENEEISDETVAVITAAIMAYYQQTNPKCEFTVKRIKRI